MRCGDFRTTYAEDMTLFDTAFARACLAVFLVALLAVPVFLGPFWLDVLNRITIAVIGAVGLNILTGFTGQISLGNAAFLAVGAYSTAAITHRWDLPCLLVIPFSGLIAALVGMV